MIIVLKNGINDAEKQELVGLLEVRGYRVREMTGEEETILGAIGAPSMDVREVEILPGVAKVMPISKPYKMASREFHPQDSVVEVGPVRIGGSRIATIAGPCAVESREQILEVAHAVREAGAVMLRGGAFKPRTSPYSFQGLGVEGLGFLKSAGEATGLPVVSEIVSSANVEVMAEYVDVFQVGTRNMQNFELLKSVGTMGLPVILKRGLAATIEEWLMAAEYLLSSGCDDVVLCERGIRTFSQATRNTLDISAIPVVRELSHLPVIVDPSHATGIRDKVPSMALAAVAAGADGLMVEVHTNPDRAMSDGAQTLWPLQFEKLMRDIEALCPTIDKELARPLKLTGSGDGSGAGSARNADKSVRAGVSGFSGRSGGGVGVEQHRDTIVFQGEHGAYSEKAIRNYFRESGVETRCLPSFDDVFKAVLVKEAVAGMVPLENSLAGSILENYDLLSRYPDVKIAGEIKVRIRHNLLARADVRLEDVKKVYSHPQALSQSAVYLEKNGLVAMPYFDTAGAAAMVANSQDTDIAAIAGSVAADYYNLNILAEDIESNPRNYTRFIVLVHETLPDPENIDKVTFTITLNSRPGALADCLAVLKQYNVDMTKLESRPIPGKPWSYKFYIDARLPREGDDFTRAVEELQKSSEDYRCLGLYRSSAA